jgi:hypothetical protein
LNGKRSRIMAYFHRDLWSKKLCGSIIVIT